jgi:large subunit ribosomal protein L31e
MSEEKSEPITRTYTIPLDNVMKTPRHRRAKRAVTEIKQFAAKHMKSEEIIIEPKLNEMLWNRGIRNPPRRITVTMDKDEDGIITITPAVTTETEQEEKETKEEAKKEKEKKSKPEETTEEKTEEEVKEEEDKENEE